MLEKIKILLGISEDNEDMDDLISVLIDLAKDDAITFCHLDEYDTTLDTIVIRMVIQLYNKRGNEGIESVGFAGISEHYTSDYTDDVVRALVRHRKLVSV